MPSSGQCSSPELGEGMQDRKGGAGREQTETCLVWMVLS